MHTPSFFFHISIDLIKPSLNTVQIAQANETFLDFWTPGEGKRSQARKHSLPHGVDKAQQECQISHRFPGATNSEAANAANTVQANDWRCDSIWFREINMSKDESLSKDSGLLKSSHGKDISANSGGAATKGSFEPLDSGEEGLGWGVVRLYRDAEETPGLYDDITTSKFSKHSKSESVVRASETEEGQSFRDEDCTMLCILAVPSYMTPSDFLGFVGDRTREEVSHFRMIRTERGNRYMVLMKFRSGKRAREWRKEWNGKLFNDMEVGMQSCIRRA